MPQGVRRLEWWTTILVAKPLAWILYIGLWVLATLVAKAAAFGKGKRPGSYS
jgi:hypothetical protein